MRRRILESGKIQSATAADAEQVTVHPRYEVDLDFLSTVSTRGLSRLDRHLASTKTERGPSHAALRNIEVRLYRTPVQLRENEKDNPEQ